MKPYQIQGATGGPSEDYDTTENVGLSDLSEKLKMKEDENQQLRCQLEREKEHTAHLYSLLNRQRQEKDSQLHKLFLEKIGKLEQELKQSNREMNQSIIELKEKVREQDEMNRRLINKESQDKERQEETLSQLHDKDPDKQRTKTSQLEDENRRLREKLDETTRKLQETVRDYHGVLRQLHEFKKNSAQREEMWNHIAYNVNKGQVLASGAWGIISKGTLPVAIKELRHYTPEFQNLFQREMVAASFCHHPNIVKFLGAGNDVYSRPYIIMELMECNLHDFIERQGHSLPLDVIVTIALNVAEALCYLHGHQPPIVYRDLKTDNILLKRRTAKLGDLGSTRVQGEHMTPYCGTLIYTAPEVLNSNFQTTQMDVWSFGLVVLEMAIGKRPNRSQLPQQIQKITDPRLKELVTACTEIEPDKRPFMQKLVMVLKENFI